MERDLFLRKYRIEQEDFDAAGVSWEELTAIADHYATIEGKLREIGKDFVDKYLYDIEKAGIHSYRYRTKAQGASAGEDHPQEKRAAGEICPAGS